MMENWQIAIIAGFAGGFLAGLLWQLRLVLVEGQVRALMNKLASPGGVQARQAKADRQTEAFAFVAQEMQTGGKTPQEILKEAATRYPDVALSLGQKLLKGKGGGFGALLGGD